MKSMDQFGKPLVSYEGAATIGLSHQEGELAIEGYFEAAQFLSGRLTVSVLPINTSRPQGSPLMGIRKEKSHSPGVTLKLEPES